MKNIFLLFALTSSLTSCGDKKNRPNSESNKLQVSAFLIYDDSSVSDFDVLNDKSIALWNTIIGEGSAVKPSHKTKIIILGSGENYSINIVNAGKTVVDKSNVSITNETNFIIDDTGCGAVEISITSEKFSYKGSIDFTCGE
jgi:hypothetical protein